MSSTPGFSAAIPARPARARFTASIAVISIRLLSVAAGLAYVKAYTAALSTLEVGNFFYLSTLSYALNALIFVPVDFYMQARLAHLDRLPIAGIRGLVQRVLLLGLLACVVLSAPLLWLGKLHLADLPALYAVAALLYLCSTSRNLLNNRGYPIFVSAMLLLESAGRLLAFVAIAAMLGGTARTLMASSALGLAVELAIIIVQARRQLPLTGEMSALDDPRTIFRAGAPIAGAAVCNAVQLQTYRVAYPLADLGMASGIYGVVSNIGAAAMAACGSIYSQIYTPRLYQSRGTSINRFVALAAGMAAGVLVVAMACAPFIVGRLTKPEYVPYALAIGFGVVTEASNLIIGAYTVLLSLERRTGVLLKFNVVTALVSVAACMAALELQPANPFLIGFSIAGSQLLMTLALLMVVRQSQAEIA